MVLTPKSGDIRSPMMAAAELFADDFMEDIEDLPLQQMALGGPFPTPMLNLYTH